MTMTHDTGTKSTVAHATADALGIIREWKSVYTLAATACACCGQSLRDAVSVTRGIGPVCSRKHYEIEFEITDDMVADALGVLQASNLDSAVKMAAKRLKGRPRDLCNVLVWWSSAHLDNADVVLECAEVVTALGFESLGDRLRERNTDIVIAEADSGFILRCRSNMTIRRNMKRVKEAARVAREGRFKYGWKFPASRKGLVWTILGEEFGGQWATIPGKPGKPSRVVKIDPSTWKDVRTAFEAAYPRPTIRKTAEPRPNVVQVKTKMGPQGELLQVIEVHTPSRNFAFVNELKLLPSRDRRWNPRLRCWIVALKHEQRVRDLVAKHFNGAK